MATVEEIVTGYSPYQQKQGESLVDFYARLSAERKGGILGTKGMLDVPAVGGELEANSDAPLGTLVKNAPIEDNRGQGDYTPQTQQEILQAAVDRMSGSALGPEKMFGKGVGTALGAFQSYSDKVNVAQALAANTDMSYDEALSYVEANPEKVGAVAASGKLGTDLSWDPGKQVSNWGDVFKPVGRELANRAGGLFGRPDLGNNVFGYAMPTLPNTISSPFSPGLPSQADYDMGMADIERIRESFDPSTGMFDFNPSDWTSDYGSGPAGDKPTIGGGSERGEGNPGGLGNGGENVSDRGSQDDASENSGYAG